MSTPAIRIPKREHSDTLRPIPCPGPKADADPRYERCPCCDESEIDRLNERVSNLRATLRRFATESESQVAIDALAEDDDLRDWDQ